MEKKLEEVMQEKKEEQEDGSIKYWCTRAVSK